MKKLLILSLFFINFFTLFPMDKDTRTREQKLWDAMATRDVSLAKIALQDGADPDKPEMTITHPYIQLPIDAELAVLLSEYRKNRALNRCTGGY